MPIFLITINQFKVPNYIKTAIYYLGNNYDNFSSRINLKMHKI